MALSRDSQARARQLANLKPNNRLEHHAYSAELKPLRERYLAELASEFPSAGAGEIALLAHRQAQMEVLMRWMDRRGLLRNRQRGEPFPAVTLFGHIASAWERQYGVLLEREQANGGVRPGDALQAIIAELGEDRDG